MLERWRVPASRKRNVERWNEINMRKDADFDIADRITVYYQAEGTVHHVFEQWADYIQAETLATAIEHQLIPEAAFQRKEKIDGLDVMVGVRRV